MKITFEIPDNSRAACLSFVMMDEKTAEMGVVTVAPDDLFDGGTAKFVPEDEGNG